MKKSVSILTLLCFFLNACATHALWENHDILTMKSINEPFVGIYTPVDNAQPDYCIRVSHDGEDKCLNVKADELLDAILRNKLDLDINSLNACMYFKEDTMKLDFYAELSSDYRKSNHVYAKFNSEEEEVSRKFIIKKENHTPYMPLGFYNASDSPFSENNYKAIENMKYPVIIITGTERETTDSNTASTTAKVLMTPFMIILDAALVVTVMIVVILSGGSAADIPNIGGPSYKDSRVIDERLMSCDAPIPSGRPTQPDIMEVKVLK